MEEIEVIFLMHPKKLVCALQEVARETVRELSRVYGEDFHYNEGQLGVGGPFNCWLTNLKGSKMSAQLYHWDTGFPRGNKVLGDGIRCRYKHCTIRVSIGDPKVSRPQSVYFTSFHTPGASGETSKNRRMTEVKTIADRLKNLSPGVNHMFVGDANWQGLRQEQRTQVRQACAVYEPNRPTTIQRSATGIAADIMAGHGKNTVSPIAVSGEYGSDHKYIIASLWVNP
eukprot:GDKI01030330.1.p1 GENE.GDKI01030330.1~~GDKI01030330.1.p1  ORF type:complete len:227 (+),score=6.81 GDKI01030330.1:368-1048(+)